MTWATSSMLRLAWTEKTPSRTTLTVPALMPLPQKPAIWMTATS